MTKTKKKIKRNRPPLKKELLINERLSARIDELSSEINGETVYLLTNRLTDDKFLIRKSTIKALVKRLKLGT